MRPIGYIHPLTGRPLGLEQRQESGEIQRPRQVHTQPYLQHQHQSRRLYATIQTKQNDPATKNWRVQNLDAKPGIGNGQSDANRASESTARAYEFQNAVDAKRHFQSSPKRFSITLTKGSLAKYESSVKARPVVQGSMPNDVDNFGLGIEDHAAPITDSQDELSGFQIIKVPYDQTKMHWICTECGSSNWALSKRCFSCKAPSLAMAQLQKKEEPTVRRSIRFQEQGERLQRSSDGTFVGFSPIQQGRASQQQFTRQHRTEKYEENSGYAATSERHVAISERPTELEHIKKYDVAADLAASKWAARYDRYDRVPASSHPNQPDYNSSKYRDRNRRHSYQFQNEDDDYDSAMARRERKSQRKREKLAQKAAAPPVPIILPEFISIGNLAAALRVRIEKFVQTMQQLGFDETSNDYVLDAETAGLIAAEFNFEPITDSRAVEDDLVALPPIDDRSLLSQRPPVVTIMGHVDHGKTTLLDWLRKSSVVASEHGGITQHIGAFTVPMPSGKVITFLDTPGHAAFIAMRQRGANVTDIVVLVVAADDGVKPQTLEALKHAQTAQVPIIVAVNKVDKEGANVERAKQDLVRHGVQIEGYGGDAQVVSVSGKTGQGMGELEEAVIALADVLDLQAPYDGPAEAWVLEATTRNSGRVATILVRRGTIQPGDVLVAGTCWTRVRTLRNEAGHTIMSASPGTPVEVDGWREQPEAGSEVLQALSEQQAKSVVELRLLRLEHEKMTADVTAVNETRKLAHEKRLQTTPQDRRAQAPAESAGQSTLQEIPFIIRADVSGSVDALIDTISPLGNAEVRPSILRSAVGPVSPSDVELAAITQAHIVTFNNPLDATIARLAESNGVRVFAQNIIYRIIEDVRGVLEEKLTPLKSSRVLGEVEILKIFDIGVGGRKTMKIAGCRVKNGVINRGDKIRILRDKEVVYDGKFGSSFIIYELFFCRAFHSSVVCVE